MSGVSFIDRSERSRRALFAAAVMMAWNSPLAANHASQDSGVDARCVMADIASASVFRRSISFAGMPSLAQGRAAHPKAFSELLLAQILPRAVAATCQRAFDRQIDVIGRARDFRRD